MNYYTLTKIQEEKQHSVTFAYCEGEIPDYKRLSEVIFQLEREFLKDCKCHCCDCMKCKNYKPN